MVVNGRRNVQKRLTGDRSGFRHGDRTALRNPSLRSGFRCGLGRPQAGSTCRKNSQPLHWETSRANTLL